MQKRKLWERAKILLLMVAITTCGPPSIAFAETSTSPNYQMTEGEFNAISNQLNCSASYCAKASIGDMSGGFSSSPTKSTASFGQLSSDSEPLLEVIVDSGVSDLGELTTERTAYKTATVRVRTYLSDGYILQILGDPPKYDGHSLSTPSSPTSSVMGSEQFGINAVANTTPSVGADPEQIPSGQVSFGVVNDDYNQPNKFMYASGDEVARSDSASGRTDYTISFIVNVSNTTPAGHFAGDYSAVVTPRF